MNTSDFFAQVALDLQDEPAEERIIQQIAAHTKIATGCDDAGILLVHARNKFEIEYDEGPCLDAVEGEAMYVSSNLDADSRWRRWGPAVAALGIHSVLSVRLETRSRRYGSLNLYADRTNAFDDHEGAVATILGRHAPSPWRTHATKRVYDWRSMHVT